MWRLVGSKSSEGYFVQWCQLNKTFLQYLFLNNKMSRVSLLLPVAVNTFGSRCPCGFWIQSSHFWKRRQTAVLIIFDYERWAYWTEVFWCVCVRHVKVAEVSTWKGTDLWRALRHLLGRLFSGKASIWGRQWWRETRDMVMTHCRRTRFCFHYFFFNY